MEKEELIKILKEYRENKSKLKLRKKQLEKYLINIEVEPEKGITNIYGINENIKSKNRISNKVENAIINSEQRQLQVLEKQEELKKEIKRLEELVEEAEIRLDSLYKKEREILVAYYVDNRDAEEIGRNLYFSLYNRICSAENIYKIVKKATKKILEL